jgi:Mlc titration factor MtfA (ptsG expression regulator)
MFEILTVNNMTFIIPRKVLLVIIKSKKNKFVSNFVGCLFFNSILGKELIIDRFINMVFQFFVLFFLGILVLLVLIFRIVEPAYMMIFNKPLYLYFYLFPKKLKREQKQILVNEFPFYNQLTNRKRIYFKHRVKEFINHYQFVGKDGLSVTDEMKVIIAGTYTMLTFGMRDYLIDLFKIIVIYPSEYFSNRSQEYHKGEFNPLVKVVAFSWEDFIRGHKITNDNLNLGLHEFSHVLHFHCMNSRDPSAIIFHDGFLEVVRYFADENLNKELHEIGYFRLYAYENQFEFLAVVLEHFFETPQIFKVKHPELYEKVFAMINFDAQSYSL